MSIPLAIIENSLMKSNGKIYLEWTAVWDERAEASISRFTSDAGQYVVYWWKNIVNYIIIWYILALSWNCDHLE